MFFIVVVVVFFVFSLSPQEKSALFGQDLVSVQAVTYVPRKIQIYPASY